MEHGSPVGRAYRHGHPEIADLKGAAGVDEHVLRLDAAVRHARGVRRHAAQELGHGGPRAGL
jgi:hypothetical protein